jgi:hypothetical protein
MTAQTFYTLSADGVSVIIDLSTGTPVVLHWGSDLGSERDAGGCTSRRFGCISEPRHLA